MPQIQRKYGWKKDKKDLRDFTFNAAEHATEQLPTELSLEDKFDSVYDQSSLGSCSANAIGGVFQFDLRKQNLKDFMPSRLFIYYNERMIEGTVSEDSGAMIRDGIKSINSQGVCNETIWPYDISKFAVQPTFECYQDAEKNKSVLYQRVNQDLNDLKTTLNAGFPIVFGFLVFASFESEEVARTGIVQMPVRGEQFMGGHAVVLAGYSDEKKAFLVRNSWGINWGLNGYFYLPYDYVTDQTLASDFWVVTLIKSTELIDNNKTTKGFFLWRWIKELFR